MQSMNERPLCHRAEDLVTYLYGEASEAEAHDFAGHMRACDACRSEFAIFQQVHESVLEWRTEALGAIPFAHAPQTKLDSVRQPATVAVEARPRLSALAAVREFFRVSPLWLRGATAIASVLFCVLVALTVARFWQQPVPVAKTANSQDLYALEQFKKAVAAQVKEEMATQSSQPQTSATVAAVENPRRPKSARRSNAVGTQMARLTRREREQLAADLHLIPSPDEEELPFVLPNDARLPNELPDEPN